MSPLRFGSVDSVDVDHGLRFHQIVNGFDLGQERLKLIQGKRTWPVAAGLVRIGVGFEEQTRQAHSHARFGQIHHLGATATGGGTARVAALEGMGDIEDQRQVVAGAFHHPEAEHVHHKVVVAEIGAPLADQQPLVAAFAELFNDCLLYTSDAADE